MSSRFVLFGSLFICESQNDGLDLCSSAAFLLAGSFEKEASFAHSSRRARHHKRMRPGHGYADRQADKQTRYKIRRAPFELNPSP